jgi:hypothetical protein
MSHIFKNTTPLSIVQLALARAGQFDSWRDSEASECKLLALGDAVGGISRAGFRGDLESRIKCAADQLYSDNHTSCGCGQGDTDPSYIPAWLEAAMQSAEDEVAYEWLEAVQPWSAFVSVLDTADAT